MRRMRCERRMHMVSCGMKMMSKWLMRQRGDRGDNQLVAAHQVLSVRSLNLNTSVLRSLRRRALPASGTFHGDS